MAENAKLPAGNLPRTDEVDFQVRVAIGNSSAQLSSTASSPAATSSKTTDSAGPGEADPTSPIASPSNATTPLTVEPFSTSTPTNFLKYREPDTNSDSSDDTFQLRTNDPPEHPDGQIRVQHGEKSWMEPFNTPDITHEILQPSTQIRQPLKPPRLLFPQPDSQFAAASAPETSVGFSGTRSKTIVPSFLDQVETPLPRQRPPPGFYNEEQ